MDVGVTTVRPGAYLKIDQSIFEITNYEHVKPGKGGAFVRLKLKNVETGAALDKTFGGETKVTRVEVSEHPAQFLFRAGDTCTFMNLESYDQIEMPVGALSEKAGYLKADIEVKLAECDGRILGVKFPVTVDLKITETPPGVKGDTVSRGTKPATLETGIVVNVPLFINPGDVIRLDTRSGDYVERV